MRIVRLAPYTALLTAVTVVACSSLPVDTVPTGPTATVTPESITLDVGDSTTVTVNSNGSGTVRWKSTDPTVVAVDSLVQLGDGAKVRARSRGSALLNGTATIDGQPYSTSVPVRVGG